MTSRRFRFFIYYDAYWRRCRCQLLGDGRAARRRYFYRETAAPLATARYRHIRAFNLRLAAIEAFDYAEPLERRVTALTRITLYALIHSRDRLDDGVSRRGYIYLYYDIAISLALH